ncbi:huntingtin-interacting protein K [Eurytemora carolleeae]|uniref:huntingtin-interacting protein K n=1 Tax=Eurytemora carolleeae TaxID=1294199 RepID=UPI000C76C3BE|nr:huntingtin-interacting protein K [Eurytemora carolleeae]|eukprot:XP_023327278.1 huntingtin-interacting protein K-like [Eurytemora affinis]
MPNKVEKDEVEEVEAGDVEAVEDKNKDRKHDWGAADLEKVTDYAEEMEILSTGNELEDAITAIRNKQALKTAEKLARERELAKVTVNKEDIELIVAEMELSKERADRCLREHDGDVVAALTSLVNS